VQAYGFFSHALSQEESHMMDWAIWFVCAGLAIAIELFTGTFYLLMVALGLLAGGVLALMGGTPEWQLLAAALVGVLAVVLLRRSRFGRRRSINAGRDPNINLDIGQGIQVDGWRNIDGAHVARVRYRGTEWDVELAPGSPVQAGNFIIREIRGSRLIVSHP
jgi:membrane protein implicated in regulation of membrane protease activity